MGRGNSINKKFELLGFHQSAFDFYVTTFVQSRYPYNIKYNEHSNWQRRTFNGKQAALDNHPILDHLIGKYWIATFPKAYTKYLCLDLDYSQDIEQRARKVLKAFPGSLVFRSSASKGLHVYYFLEKNIRNTKFERLIRRRLDFFGIEARPGLCEIFPQEVKPLRLPLGKGSFLLDEINLKPLHETLLEELRLVKRKLIYHSVTELFLPDEYFEKRTLAGTEPLTRPVAGEIINGEVSQTVSENTTGSSHLQNDLPYDPSSTLKGKEFKEFIEYVLRFGIETEGTRFEIQKKLIYHFWSQGLSEEMTFQKVRDWYLSFDHNSKDWRSNKNQVLRKLKNDVNCLFKNNRGRFQPRSRSHLTTGDIKYITDTNADYRTQLFIFSLLEYAKSHQDGIDSLALPRKLITTFKGCTDRTYQDRIKFCQSIGLIGQVNGHNRYKRQSKTFKINYRFKEDKTVWTLEEGLSEILSKEEIKQKYSSYFVRKMSKMQQY